jgi:hypothetical protein
LIYMSNNFRTDLRRPELSSEHASRSKDLLKLLADSLIYEISAVCRGEAQINCLDEMLVIFEITAQDLACEVARVQAFLCCDLGEPGFLVGL